MPLALAAMRKEWCTVCSIFPEESNSAYYYFNTDLPVHVLGSASEKGCGFCKILYDVCRETPILAEEVFPDGIIQVRCGIRYEIILTPSSNHSKLIELYMPSMSPGSPFTWLTRLRDISEYSLSTSCYKFLRQWIVTCIDEHEPCNTGRQSTYPSRLLDVGSKESDTVHLVMGESNLLYISLSHSWGRSSPSRTTTLNLTERELRIPESDLSRSFQDAVTFARWIGIRYLWIDCLCIIQDDEEDWEKESAKMASIYSGAFLVLGATQATGCDEGFLGPREKSWNVGSYTFWNISFEVHARRPISHDISLGSVEWELAHSPLLHRGWCFQERMLASRMVHFTNREIIFHCRKSIQCECGGYTSSRRRPALSNYYKPGVFPSASSHRLDEHAHRMHRNHSRMPADVSLDDIDNMRGIQFYIHGLYLSGKENGLEPRLAPIWFGEMWGDMVADYTATELTYSKDILPALSGVARVMRAFSPGRYIAGLWELDLHYQLGWTSNLDESYCYRASTYTAPSFTWASRIGKVMFPYNITITKVCSIVDISCSPKGFDAFGQVSNGLLKLEGKMIGGISCLRDSQICLFRQRDENSNAGYGETERLPKCEFGYIDFDTTTAKVEMLGRKLFCFELYWETGRDDDCEDEDCNHICGILLEKAVEADVYHRVGLVRDAPVSWFETVSEVSITIT